MLAYVFWHWPRPSVAAAEYDARQRAFHEALAAAPSEGFVRSFTHGIAGAPWANAGGAAYEDWYLVRDSAALDPLNAAAISASRQQPHDAAAALAGGGTAGLYSLRAGAVPAAVRYAAWFAKPAGTSYPELFAELTPLVEARGAALFGRQMTLGPATEFCVVAAEAVALPAKLAAITPPLRRVWPT